MDSNLDRIDTMARIFIILGSLSGLFSVLLGAFGAHALRSRLSPERMRVYRTAEQYQFSHALALFGIGLLALHLPGSVALCWAGWLMFTGIVLFSGSLYVLALTDIRAFGIITPFGGTAFVAGWALLAIAAARGL